MKRAMSNKKINKTKERTKTESISRVEQGDAEP